MPEPLELQLAKRIVEAENDSTFKPPTARFFYDKYARPVAEAYIRHAYEAICRERCQLCAAGSVRYAETYHEGDGLPDCAAPTKDAYIAELEKDRDHMQASWAEATRQLHEVRNSAIDKIAELEARNAELKAERDRLAAELGDKKGQTARTEKTDGHPIDFPALPPSPALLPAKRDAESLTRGGNRATRERIK